MANDTHVRARFFRVGAAAGRLLRLALPSLRIVWCAVPWSPQPWSPCWNPFFEFWFGSHYTYPFYTSDTNYLDVTCRNGDGWFSDDRMPCSWYHSMASYAHQAYNNRGGGAAL